MQRFRAASATIALFSRNKPLVDHIVPLIEDEATTMDVYSSFDGLLHALPSTGPDVVIIDDQARHDASRQILTLRRRQPMLHLVYVCVGTEARGIELLHWGADDAITASSPALVARLQAAARRARTMNAGARIAVGDIVFDRESRRVWCAGREVSLTPLEFRVVDCLFWHTPKAASLDTVVEFVWGGTPSNRRRGQVPVYMSYLRKKLAASRQVVVRFTKGEGYEFVPRGEG